jgi:hypothetical protein
MYGYTAENLQHLAHPPTELSSDLYRSFSLLPPRVYSCSVFDPPVSAPADPPFLVAHGITINVSCGFQPLL